MKTTDIFLALHSINYSNFHLEQNKHDKLSKKKAEYL
jgi:hypothetical protein